MAAGKKNYELEILISGGTDASLSASIGKARKEIDSLERKSGIAAGKIGESFGGMSVKGIDSLGQMSDKVFGAMLKGTKIAAGGMTAVLGASTMVGMGFEAQMSTVQAISQASNRDMERLTALAKEMGETTQFSAEEAGQGLEYMAMAGWKTKDMINGLPGVMYLAAASGEELGTVSDIVTDAMTAFEMRADESARFVDVLAQTSASANTNVGMMGETFQYIAPVAGAFGYKIEDIAIATGLMANAGIKGQKAGTAMRTMLTNLAKPTKQMRGYMEDLSISLVDSNGNMKPFRQQMTELRNAFDKLAEAEKAEYAAGIAGKEGMSGLLALVNANNDDFEKLAEAIDNSSGAAKKMSEVRLDNLSGDLTLLKSAAQGAGIEIFGGFSDSLRDLTQTATGWISGFTDNIREDMPAIRRRAKQFGQDVGVGFQPILKFGSWCLSHPGVIKGTLAGIATAMGTFKAVQGVSAGVKLLTSLSGVISAWPVAAAGVAAGAIAGVVVAVKENNRRLKKEDMAKRFGEISLSMEELDKTARMIVDDGSMQKATEAVGTLGKVRELAEEFEEANKTIDKLNWKIGMDFGLDDGDKEAYASAIDKLVTSSIDIVQQSQYTAQISVQALFGNSAAGNEIVNGFNDMYGAINGEVQTLGRQLGDAYSAALEDGVIDVDEAKTIQELQQKLATITKEVSQAQFDAKLERISAQMTGKELDPETFKNLQMQVQETLTERQASLEQAADATLAALGMQYNRGDISLTEYNRKKTMTTDELNVGSMLSSMKGVQWSVDSITSAYGDVLEQAVPGIQERFAEAMNDSMTTISMDGNMALAFDPDVVERKLGLKEIDKAARDGIKELWEMIQPEYEALQQQAISFKEAGKAVPQAVADGLNEAAVIGAIAGNNDAIMHMMAVATSENPEYQKVINQAREDGAAIPNEIAVYMDKNSSNVEDAANRTADLVQQTLMTRFGSMNVEGKLSINLTPDLSRIPVMPKSKKLAHYAKGGLIEQPTLSWFAEDSPEMAIPIDGSRRSLDLWREAGGMLGAYEAYGRQSYGGMYQNLTTGTVTENYNNSSFAPVFNPIINVQGGAETETQLDAGIEAAYERFKDFVEQYDREKFRVAF